MSFLTIGATALGVFYVLGLLCVNAYGSRFGFTQYSLVQAQYLSAGAWVPASLLVSSLFFVIGIHNRESGQLFWPLFCLMIEGQRRTGNRREVAVDVED